MEPMDVDRASCVEMIDPALVALTSGAQFQASNLNFGASRSQRSRRHQDASPHPRISCPSSSPHPPVNDGPRMNWQLQRLFHGRKIKVSGKKADLITHLSVCNGAPSTPSSLHPSDTPCQTVIRRGKP
ncbi:hypothetical protein M405DRAFT_808668 [Rhizopogon salebrosus TDB-379]|nr:hypothetical protein M405DRAFT_808668 [Rhizopogon salebrosus TDB-379]